MSILTSLAARASAQSLVPTSGRSSYIHTRSWNLAVDQMTDGQIVRSGIEQTDRELWIAEDGSGRIRENRAGRPTQASAHYAAGQLTGLVTDGSPATAAQAIEHITQAWRSRVVTPVAHSAMLVALGTQTDLTVAGGVTDRAGRPGIAVASEQVGSAIGERTDLRRILILDPNTGMLLSYKQVALTAGSLPVDAPATISYEMWLMVRYLDNTNTPAG